MRRIKNDEFFDIQKITNLYSSYWLNVSVHCDLNIFWYKQSRVCSFEWNVFIHFFFVYFSFCESVTKNARNNDTTNLMLLNNHWIWRNNKKKYGERKKPIKMLIWWDSVLCLQRIWHDLYFVNEWLKTINCCYSWQLF